MSTAVEILRLRKDMSRQKSTTVDIFPKATSSGDKKTSHASLSDFGLTWFRG
jgi:hypothetical protein